MSNPCRYTTQDRRIAFSMGDLVCVTGAGGFIGSWVVRELLLQGYVVRGTARDPEDPKNSHLWQLEGAKERLSLYRADVLDYHSLRIPFHGCDGVFHVASQVANNQEVVTVAVEGTKNVINAAADVGIKRIIFTSSYGAVHMNPKRSPDAILDESCRSDLDYCKQTKNWYCYSKMIAELAAMEEAKKRGVQLVVVVPSLTIGTMLQPTINASVYRVLVYMNGAKKAYPNAVAGYVDVLDVARAHVLVFEDPGAHGRYLCIGAVKHRSELVRSLRELFPQYPVTTRCEDTSNKFVQPYKFSNKRLKDLGLEFTPFKESLYRTVLSLQEKGHLPMVLLSSL